MVSIKKIAEVAGVSPSTVSNVLQGRFHKMKADTLERVRRVIRDHNYISNMSGRTLGRHGSRIIAVVMDYQRRDELNALQHPFFGEILGALEHEIRNAGYFMMLYISAGVEESLRMAASWDAEGIIATGCNEDNCRKFIEGAEKLGIPMVFIDAYYEGGSGFFNVGLHDRQGGFMMADYLAGLGHKRIAFLADMSQPEGVDVDYERRAGCGAALAGQGCSFSREDFVHISYHPGERRDLLRCFIRDRLAGYSALFFASDYLAADSINILHDEGIRVPEDVSVAGFDDKKTRSFCRFPSPSGTA